MVLYHQALRLNKSLTLCAQDDCGENEAIITGNESSDTAKMTAITPDWSTFKGKNVLCPPIIFRPTTRFAYCTGILRWPVSSQTTKPVTANTAAKIINAPKMLR